MTRWTDHDLSLAAKLVYPPEVQSGRASGIIHSDVDRDIVYHLGCRVVGELLTCYATDTQCVILERGGHYVLSFRGTKEIPDYLTSAKELLGRDAWEDCWDSVEPLVYPALYRELPRLESLNVVGHSLGGPIAMHAGEHLHDMVNLRVTAFAPPKLRPSSAARISRDTPVRIFRHRLDPVTYMASSRWQWPKHAEIIRLRGFNWDFQWQGGLLGCAKKLAFANHSIDFISRSIPQEF